MISLQSPPESAATTYAACAALTKDPSLRAKLALETDRVAQRSQLYLIQASNEAYIAFSRKMLKT